jgi:hypothetical protein
MRKTAARCEKVKHGNPAPEELTLLAVAAVARSHSGRAAESKMRRFLRQ